MSLISKGRSSWHENHRHLKTTKSTETCLLEDCLYVITAFENGCDYELYYNETGSAIKRLNKMISKGEVIE